MLATAATLALLAIVGWTLVTIVHNDRNKILAALRGQSWIVSPPVSGHPVTVRVSQRYPAVRPMRAQPEWRAAA